MSSEFRPSVDELLQSRRVGAQGGVIKMHHALRSLTLSRAAIVTILLMPLVFDLLLWINLDAVLGFWEHLFGFWIEKMGLTGQVMFSDIEIPGRILHMPYPNLPSFLPSAAAVRLNVILCVLAFLISELFPSRFMPLTYLLRAAILIQASASVYFFFNPDTFPYDLENYFSSMMVLGIYMMFLVSPVLALIYYIFDFPLWRKCVVTGLVIGYFIIFVPFQYMLHALVISNWGYLFMPVVYLLFGLLLDTLMFVSWYAWAMTWKPQTK